MKKKEWLFLFSQNFVSYKKKNFQFIISASHHGSFSSKAADVLIPTITPFEKSGFFFNIHGSHIKAMKVLPKSSFFLIPIYKFLMLFFRYIRGKMHYFRIFRENKLNYYITARIRRKVITPLTLLFNLRLKFLLPSFLIKRPLRDLPKVLHLYYPISGIFSIKNTSFSFPTTILYSLYDIFSVEFCKLRVLAYRRFSRYCSQLPEMILYNQ